MEITSGLPGTGGWPLSVGVKDCLAEQAGVAGVDAGGGIAKVDGQAVAEACCQAKDPFLPGGAGQVAFVERVDRRGPVDAGQFGAAEAGAWVHELGPEIAASEPGGLADDRGPDALLRNHPPAPRPDRTPAAPPPT